MSYLLSFALPFILCSNVFLVLCINEMNSGMSTTRGINDYSWKEWCKFQPNTNDCNNGRQNGRFYYDIKLEDCKTFIDGGCPNSYNKFNTITECHETCNDVGTHMIKDTNLTEQVLCRLQPDFGMCQDYHPMFYYDINTQLCKGFSYSGCGGNANRFATSQLCSSICGPILGSKTKF